jgi:hypothetical protein
MNSTNDNEINIKGLNKVDILKILWKNTEPSAIYKARNKKNFDTFDQSAALIEVEGYIDYFCGRAIKMDLSKDVIDTGLYDRDSKISAREALK